MSVDQVHWLGNLGHNPRPIRASSPAGLNLKQCTEISTDPHPYPLSLSYELNILNTAPRDDDHDMSYILALSAVIKPALIITVRRFGKTTANRDY